MLNGRTAVSVKPSCAGIELSLPGEGSCAGLPFSCLSHGPVAPWRLPAPRARPRASAGRSRRLGDRLGSKSHMPAGGCVAPALDPLWFLTNGVIGPTDSIDIVSERLMQRLDSRS